MVIDAMLKAIKFVEVVWQCEARVLLMKVSNDLVSCWRDLKEQWMVDKLGETVKWQLVIMLITR